MTAPGITFFTVPKAFIGHIATIQSNALSSWNALGADVEILIFGNEPGTREAALASKAKHVPDTDVNDFGTPLISDVFARASRMSTKEVLCFVNADIILSPSISAAAGRIPSGKYLGAGQRWDLDVKEVLDFSNDRIWEDLTRLAKGEGRLHPPTGSDYFMYPRGIDWEMPPFAVGRPGWDNWLIYKARLMRIPVIDMTPSVFVIHQNHDYSHVVGARGSTHHGPEGDRNLALIGDSRRTFTLKDATYRLGGGLTKVRPAPADLLRQLITFDVVHPWASFPVKVIRKILRTYRSLFHGRRQVRS